MNFIVTLIQCVTYKDVFHFYAPVIKWQGGIKCLLCLSFHHSVPSKFVFSTSTSLHGFEWNLAGMLHHKSRSVCWEIIYVWQILAVLWPLTLRSFTHFSLSSQLLHPFMDLNKTWQGCCTTSLEVQVGRWFMFDKFWQSYGPWYWNTHFSLSSQLLLHPCMDLNETWQGCCTTSLEVPVGRWFMFDKFWQSYGPWYWNTHFSLSSQLLLHPCMDLNETWQGCCTTSLEVPVGRWFMFDKFWQSYGPWHWISFNILTCLDCVNKTVR